MTSLIAARGSGRSTSVIPAVPAASSVTTIAFIRHLLVSSLRLQTGHVIEPAVDREGSCDARSDYRRGSSPDVREQRREHELRGRPQGGESQWLADIALP